MWGLPASDGWDNDGVAPRDFLYGLVESFTAGHSFTYPPAHLALLALVTLPITVVLLVKAPSLARADLVREAIQVPYMTSYALVARVVTLVMSLVIVYLIGKTAEALAGKRAGLVAAAICAVNCAFAYYSCTSNLDVPYLFWGVFALRALVHAMLHDEPRKLRVCALWAALAVATKDQAYGLFVLGIPLAVGLWLASDRRPRLQWRTLTKELLISAVIAVVVVLVVDGAVTNPTGFRQRLSFLAGPASQPYAHYSADARGRFLACLDSLLHFDTFYPAAFAVFAVLGLVRAARFSAARRAAALAPLALLGSFTLLFDAVARRDEPRFFLPQMVLWAIYAGLGVDGLWALRHEGVRLAVRAFVFGAFAVALYRMIGVHAVMLFDPRYEAERWLATHVSPGDDVEIHGNNVYLMRMPRAARVVRVGTDPLDKRSPLPGVEEREDAYSRVQTRAPKWIVFSEAFASHYLWPVAPQTGIRGRVVPEMQVRSSADQDATSFFRALVEGRSGYRMVHEFTWKSDLFPRVDYHGTLGCTYRIYERVE
ncbi:MAG TPA: glycosyltransferase family 39 protein [Polyangiaceae bacterium]|nr:glycosyltransferase family 39 protein [Polyangiaceae bacterium]